MGCTDYAYIDGMQSDQSDGDSEEGTYIWPVTVNLAIKIYTSIKIWCFHTTFEQIVVKKLKLKSPIVRFLLLQSKVTPYLHISV